ncbi:Teneurin-3 [Dissostichus eleginoides]|uniref:Teneurin-3 n=1 Tax=Dissostichus eleginoides TaxID=100907 RepID=A0AAD9CQJ3_DISEL|nr:Teneurin-3 [Dissostichus eleginoides]
MQRSISHPGTYTFDRSGVLKEFVGGGQRSQRRNRTCSDSSLYDAELKQKDPEEYGGSEGSNSTLVFLEMNAVQQLESETQPKVSGTL